jgi:hypothetical protein
MENCLGKAVFSNIISGFSTKFLFDCFEICDPQNFPHASFRPHVDQTGMIHALISLGHFLESVSFPEAISSKKCNTLRPD